MRSVRNSLTIIPERESDPLRLECQLESTQHKLIASNHQKRDQEQVIDHTNRRLEKLQIALNMLEIQYSSQQKTLQSTCQVVKQLQEQEEMKTTELKEMTSKINHQKILIQEVLLQMEQGKASISEKEKLLLDGQLSLAQLEEQRHHCELQLTLMVEEGSNLNSTNQEYSGRLHTLQKKIDVLSLQKQQQLSNLQGHQLTYCEVMGKLLVQEKFLADLTLTVQSHEQKLLAIDQQLVIENSKLEEIQKKIQDKILHQEQIVKMVAYNQQRLSKKQEQYQELAKEAANLQVTITDGQAEMEQLSGIYQKMMGEDLLTESPFDQLMMKLERQFFHLHRLLIKEKQGIPCCLSFEQLLQLERAFWAFATNLELFFPDQATIGIGAVHYPIGSSLEVQMEFAKGLVITGQEHKEILLKLVQHIKRNLGSAPGLNFKVLTQLNACGMMRRAKIIFSLKNLQHHAQDNLKVTDLFAG